MTVYSLDGKRVFVAGSRGMVGSAIVRDLAKRGCAMLTPPRSELDLRDRAGVDGYFAAHRPQAVFLAAARVGGIHANRSRPVEFLEENLRIQLNVISAAHDHAVERLVFLGSSCIYPKFAGQPIAEDELLTGPLESTNQWYAIAKIAGIKQCQAYRQQYGDSFVSAMPCNLYGYGDNFDLETSHVLPALIRKAHEAMSGGREQLVVWGTGTPRREFLFADDAADGLTFVCENYDDDQHVNVGSGSDLAISELVDIVCRVVGFKGEVVYDSAMPDGTPRKLMDSSRLFSLGWRPATDIETGIEKLYGWFRDNFAG